MTKPLNKEDRRFLLASIARKFACHKIYEIDELINEAWLDKNVRKQTELKNFCMAARWAMINYMRKQEKRDRKKFHPKFQPLIIDNNHKMEPAIIPNNDLESSECISWMLEGLTKKQKQIVKLRVVDGFYLKTIGRIFGVSKERIRQILKESYDIMQIRYRKICA